METSNLNKYGIAGKIAGKFINSKLTPIFIISFILLGVFSIVNLPREEEPQINVPMFDVFVPFHGASPKEIENHLLEVGERKLWEIPNVEYVYSMAQPNFALFTVRFKVGVNPEEAATLIYSKTFAYEEMLSQGAGPANIKARSIDDVPIMALTFWSKEKDDYDLRRVAASVQTEINSINNVSETLIIGGHKRQFLIHFDPAKLAAQRLTPLQVAGIIKLSNSTLPAGRYSKNDNAFLVETDSYIRSVEDLKNIIVGVSDGKAVKLSDIAKISDGPDEEEKKVLFQKSQKYREKTFSNYPAVTISIAKRRGANATKISKEVIKKIDSLKGGIIDEDVNVTITRNYGETAKHKSNELLFHLLVATISVTFLIALTLGWREAIVVLITIPVTLALTLFTYQLYGYTLNRITLFALIFSIGILVDDAIVVIENINRHCLIKNNNSFIKNVLNAVDEVGNPTILATWTVIASILPMAFVSGLMGPYMRPIPMGASVAMLFSLLIAFMATPWLFVQVIKLWPLKHCEHVKESYLDKLFRKIMKILMRNSRAGKNFLIAMGILFILSVSLMLFKLVIFKTLPFDNKNEFQIVINMPEDSSLKHTEKAVKEIADYLTEKTEVKNLQSYIGTSAPYNFNGLVRHYYLRQMPYQADIQVNLIKNKDKQSHEIALNVRQPIQSIAKKYNARVQIAEIPPGPPVLATLVIEVFGPNPKEQLALAKDIRALLEETPGIVDVDSYIPNAQPLEKLIIDRQKATLNGIPSSIIAQINAMALHGHTLDTAHIESEHEPVEIKMRLAPDKRKNLEALKSIKVFSPNGTAIAIGDLIKSKKTLEKEPIFHKNLQRTIYITADVAGGEESPIYSIINLQKGIKELGERNELKIKQYFTKQPDNVQELSIKWDGEWQISYEVFRDLGIAFLVALILIYILVVAWFEDFITPLIIMSAIPLALIGIIPAHWMLGSFFTATSMIGFIASAGIVVRNSIILVDFIQLEVKNGLPLEKAVIEAGIVRFKPMLLTALAVIAGAGVILFDPIFQGLAIALISGQIAATLLSRIAVPLLYYMTFKNEK
ncbi:MAG: efflux RND transporter permease subunit [Elusimicrobiota bacterium]|nr:efflux RND transporter permease subunit [Elusimicrobiota bacterium]